jgi:hypothetical protein
MRDDAQLPRYHTREHQNARKRKEKTRWPNFHGEVSNRVWKMNGSWVQILGQNKKRLSIRVGNFFCWKWINSRRGVLWQNSQKDSRRPIKILGGGQTPEHHPAAWKERVSISWLSVDGGGNNNKAQG